MRYNLYNETDLILEYLFMNLICAIQYKITLIFLILNAKNYKTFINKLSIAVYLYTYTHTFIFNPKAL